MSDCNAQCHFVELCSWDEVPRLSDALAATKGGWRFRGHTDAGWPLQTTMERSAWLFRRQNPAYRANPLKGLSDVERRILMTFRPQAHLHGVTIPHDASPLEWLALVQHYGGPTRLLDFTQSLWIAVFHAIQPSHNRAKTCGHHAVWAIRTKPLCNQAMRQLGVWSEGELTKNECRFMQDRQIEAREQCVNRTRFTPDWHVRIPPEVACLTLPFEPEYLNARLAAQQGSFIFPLNDEASFEDNLFGTFGLAAPPSQAGVPEEKRGVQLKQWENDSRICLPGLLAGLHPARGLNVTDDFEDGKPKIVILKILLPSRGDDIREPMAKLQAMNVTWSSLFPDLTGMAQSGNAAFWE